MRRSLQSLGVRLALLFFAGVLLLLLLAGGAILGEQEHSLLHAIDSNLNARADDIVALLEDDTSPESLGVSRDEDTLAVLLDADGGVLTSTDRFGDPSRLSAQLPVPTDRGEEVSLPSYAETAGSERMRAVRLTGPDGEAVFVAQSLERVEQNLASLRSTLLFVGMLTAVLAGTMCWVVVRRALRPVGEIVAQAADMSLARLDRRLPTPKRSDEIGELTVALNTMLERLEASAEQQRQLVADMAHELRSPLTGIATQLEVELTHPEQADWPLAASEALAESRRLQRIIDDLLLLAQLDEGVDDDVHGYVDLDQLVLETVARMAPLASVAIDLSGVSAGLIRGSTLQLERAVQNVIANALQHAASTVTVTLHDDGGVVVLSVSDDGPGIPAAQRERVFERFYRIQSARDRDTGGTGLGLALTRETIRAHGGAISVADAIGGGAVVRIELPSAEN